MTQVQWLILAFKVVTVAGFASLAAWIAVYTRLAKWWQNDIGRTLVAKTALIALLLVPTALSLFFHLSGRTSLAMAWVDVGLIALITPVMLWRIAVWLKVYRAGKKED